MFKKFILLCFSVALFTSNRFLPSVNATGAEDMKIESKIGKMMCLDFRFWHDKDLRQTEKFCTISSNNAIFPLKPVVKINDEIKEIISRYHIGSVVLFSENFQSKEQSRKLIYDLQKAAIDSGNPPLLVYIDQEGGRVERFSFGRKSLKNN